MDPSTAGIVGMMVLFIFLFAGMPIAFGLFLVGFFGFCYLVTFTAGLSLIGIEPLHRVFSYDLAVIPLFILMGALAFASGLSRDFYHATYKWIGHLPGGLAMATIVGCAGFAAVCGSSLATAATMGAVAIPEMRRFRYNTKLATGSVAAGGTLGILIPPSVIFILYGIMTKQSIGKLFLAGIIPGVVLAILFITSIYIQSRLNPALGPPGPRTPLKEKLMASGGFCKMLAIFILIMGGFFVGWFTPTEAGAVGAFLVLVVGLIERKLSLKGIVDSLLETGRTAGMIYMLVIGAMIFNRFLAVTRIPFELADYIGGLSLSPRIIMVLILIMYLIFGCVMDSLAMILITVPIVYPVVLALGFDPIWFGVIVVIMMEVGLITPPVGLNVYIIQGVSKDVSLVKIWQGILPLLPAMIAVVALLLIFPKIALFLPGLMK